MNVKYHSDLAFSVCPESYRTTGPSIWDPKFQNFEIEYGYLPIEYGSLTRLLVGGIYYHLRLIKGGCFINMSAERQEVPLLINLAINSQTLKNLMLDSQLKYHPKWHY